MKYYILLLFAISNLTVKGQTNIYHQFPDSNAVWNFWSSGYCFSFSATSTDLYSITFAGDTVIKGQNYHKLAIPFIKMIGTHFCGINEAGYKGAIREDIGAKKVYYYASKDTAEKLLYDFTLELGDTVKGYLERSIFPFLKDTIVSIDSVLVGNNYRKRWLINSWYKMYMIEGIGTTYGLIEVSPSKVTDQVEYMLTCFSQEGQNLYPSTTSDCQLITSTVDLPDNIEQVSVFPNPSYGSVTVDFKELAISEIQLCDLVGKVILKRKIENQSKIIIEDLPNGLFIMTLLDKDNRIFKKRIVSLR